MKRHFSIFPAHFSDCSHPAPEAPHFPPTPASAAAAKSLQSCLTLCDPIDGSPPGSPTPGILQVRTLEWVAISFSNAWQWTVKVKSHSRVRLSATPWTAAYQAPHPWDSPGKSTGVGCHCHLLHLPLKHWYSQVLINSIHFPWVISSIHIMLEIMLMTHKSKCQPW